MKQITFLVSDELHKEFKTHCSAKGIQMKDALLLAIEIILQDKHKKIKVKK